MRAGDVGVVEKNLVAVEKTGGFAKPIDQHFDSVGSGCGESQVTGAG